MHEQRKRRRAFHRIMSGFEATHYPREQVRFLTLTSSSSEVGVLIHKHFRALQMRIRRRWGKFDYLAIRTDEGHGVYHVLFRGRYIPQDWLSRQWQELHDSPIVDIRLVKHGRKRMANYMVAQYVSGQGFERLSWSWNWVFRGFVGAWQAVKRAAPKDSPWEALRVWRIICKVAHKVKYVKMKGAVWLELEITRSQRVTWLLGKKPMVFFMT